MVNKKEIYFSFETLFASTSLPESFIEDFIKQFLEHQPLIVSNEKISTENET